MPELSEAGVCTVAGQRAGECMTGCVNILPAALEIFGIAIIRVGDRLALAIIENIEQQGDLGSAVSRRARLDPGHIRGIEGEDMGEIEEIRFCQLASDGSGDVDAIGFGHRNRSRVRSMADVVIGGPNGVDDDFKADLGSGRFQRPLCHGRAANIAEADKEDSWFACRSLQHVYTIPQESCLWQDVTY